MGKSLVHLSVVGCADHAQMDETFAHTVFSMCAVELYIVCYIMFSPKKESSERILSGTAG